MSYNGCNQRELRAAYLNRHSKNKVINTLFKWTWFNKKQLNKKHLKVQSSKVEKKKKGKQHYPYLRKFSMMRNFFRFVPIFFVTSEIGCL